MTYLAQLGFTSLPHFVFQVLAMSLTAFALPRLRVTSIFGPLLMVAALGLVNTLYWNEDLFGFIPTEFNIKIVGLFVANGLLFWILVKILPGIEIRGILPALAAPVIFSLLNLLFARYLPEVPWADLYQTSLSYVNENWHYYSGLVPEAK